MSNRQQDGMYVVQGTAGKTTMNKIVYEALNEELVETDGRQDENHLFSCDSFAMSRREEEDPVHLYPRYVPSYELHDDDISSLQACTSSSDNLDVPGPMQKEFLREYPCPTMPQSADSPSPREKPALCRSLAWSQDSMEDRRVLKRFRFDQPLSVLAPLSLVGSPQDPNATSPTMVHWEHQLYDCRDLAERATHNPATPQHQT